MKTANLFGPFVGELTWEFFRFAPYAIALKKKRPRRKLIVLTRASRFDLYGQYADIFVPLNLKEDRGQNKFGLWSLDHIGYKALADMFSDKYSSRYRIVHHFYPNIRGIFRKIKWQFPRMDMDYDFKPRVENDVIVNSIIRSNDYVLFDDISEDKPKNVIDLSSLIPIFASRVDNVNTTVFGCMITTIRRAKTIIGNLDCSNTRLALLLKKPVILVAEKRSEDIVNLFNPLKAPIFYSESSQKGVDIYHENFV